MKSRVLILWEGLRASYWFIPTLMVCAAFVLLQLTLSIDASAEFESLTRSTWLHFGSADGAREILATISGALITLTATVFTLTMVVLTVASSHYGIRLLRNFMKDRSTQYTLGVFIGTFVYCILTLRCIQGGGQDAFVPHLSINAAMLFTLISMAFLVYFIHHTANRIQAPEVIASLSSELDESINGCFLAEEKISGNASGGTEKPDVQNLSAAVCLTAPEDGYIQAIDYQALVTFAERDGLAAQIHGKVGDFVIAGQNLVTLYKEGPLAPKTAEGIMGSIVTGSYRTTKQDVRFAVEQIVEVAQRALSPGINESLVAMMCIDRISAALVKVAELPLAFSSYFGKDRKARLFLSPVTFEELFSISFATIANDAGNNPSARTTLLEKARVIRGRAKRSSEQQIMDTFISYLENERNEGLWHSVYQLAKKP